MKLTRVTAVLFTAFVGFGLKLNSGDPEADNSELELDEIIEKYGYPLETHEVETEDGYILEMQRIPCGRNEDCEPGVPVLILHGLLSDSSQFFFLEEDSLPFLLADNGYDVWLGNFRGTAYGLEHVTLSPRSSEFWDFSWHEFGAYDLPAQLDYVCDYTKSNNILILGYSMGTTATFVMGAVRPEYQKKIRGAVMMGPVLTLRGIRSPSALLSPFATAIQVFSDIFSNGKFFDNDRLKKKLTKSFCAAFPEKLHACRNFIFALCGADAEEFNEKIMHVMLGHMPASTSTKTLTHFLQILKSGKFHQYDYGQKENLRLYKSRTPAEYNVELVTVPLSLIIAPNDVFIGKKDVRILKERLSSIKSIDFVDFNRFTHIDFFLAKHAKTLVYKVVLERFRDLLDDDEVYSKAR